MRNLILAAAAFVGIATAAHAQTCGNMDCFNQQYANQLAQRREQQMEQQQQMQQQLFQQQLLNNQQQMLEQQQRSVYCSTFGNMTT